MSTSSLSRISPLTISLRVLCPQVEALGLRDHFFYNKAASAIGE